MELDIDFGRTNKRAEFILAAIWACVSTAVLLNDLLHPIIHRAYTRYR
jgi:hypothetical protein